MMRNSISDEYKYPISIPNAAYFYLCKSRVNMGKLSCLLTVSVVVAVVLMGCTEAKPKPDDKYTTKYDNVDLDQILKNKRLLKNYVNCILEKGNCSPDGAELKKTIPDAIKTECSKCSETQKNGSRKVLRHLIDNEAEWWKEIEEKYDPEGTYREKYREEAKKEGFDI